MHSRKARREVGEEEEEEEDGGVKSLFNGGVEILGKWGSERERERQGNDDE